MRSFTSRPSAGLFYLVISGLLWGTGGLTGSLLGRVAGLSAIAVAACRLTAGGVLIVGYLTATRRTWPSGRAAWARITVIGLLAAIFQSCYFTAVSLTSVPLATLITIGAAPVIVLGAERATGRPAGPLAVLTTGLAVTGLGLLVGLPSGFRETAVLASAGMAVLAAAGFAAITLISTRPVAGLDDLAVTGFGFTIGGLLLMPAAAASGRHRVPARARGDRPAGRAGHRPDRGGLHAVLPRPADRGREHGRPAGPARTADRRHPRGPAARRAAERDRDRRRGHHRRGRDPHRAGGSRRPRWRRRWRRCSATPPPAATGAGSAGECASTGSPRCESRPGTAIGERHGRGKIAAAAHASAAAVGGHDDAKTSADSAAAAAASAPGRRRRSPG